MKEQHILLLGITGVSKNNALTQLKSYQEKTYGEIKFDSIDFEDLIFERTGVDIYEYLEERMSRQREYWLKGWKELKERINSLENPVTILSMHGTLTRDVYGARTPIIIQKIVSDFKPTKIITLFNDIYFHWYETKKRAKGQAYKGMPTLEQLLQARRAEIMLGDIISNQIFGDFAYKIYGKEISPPHYLVSVWHPARLLDKIIFSHPNLEFAYMAFPISTPRDALNKRNDQSLIEELNGIFKNVNEFEKDHPELALFCPLTIDELPLKDLLNNDDRIEERKERDREGNKVTVKYRKFCYSDRWDVIDIYKDEIILLDTDEIPEKIAIPEEEIKDAQGLINSDVHLRDYQLIKQSDRLAVYNPIIGDERKISDGVMNEINYAEFLLKPRYIFQNTKYDKEGIVENTLLGGSKTMEDAFGSKRNIISHDLQEHLNSLLP